MKTLLFGALLAFAGTAASAQSVDQRHAIQQQRIGGGIASGQITPHEAGRLEAQQHRIDRSEARMRARNGGTLTRYQRARLQHRETIASHAIYNKKNNWHRD